MTKKLSELLNELPAEERQESAIEAARLAIGLKDLQAVAGILQTELARSLGSRNARSLEGSIGIAWPLARFGT